MDGEAAGALFGLVCIGTVALVSLAGAAFQIWMIVDCAVNEPKQPDNQTVLWILVILFGSWIGALVYYFVRKSNRRPNTGQYGQYQQPQYPQKPPY